VLLCGLMRLSCCVSAALLSCRPQHLPFWVHPHHATLVNPPRPRSGGLLLVQELQLARLLSCGALLLLECLHIGVHALESFHMSWPLNVPLKNSREAYPGLLGGSQCFLLQGGSQILAWWCQNAAHSVLKPVSMHVVNPGLLVASGHTASHDSGSSLLRRFNKEMK
jgi:hypothetical protein